MKFRVYLYFSLAVLCGRISAAPGLPYADAAEQPTTTAIHKDDAAFTAWADGYTNLQFGTELVETWKVPANTLGKAEGTATDVMSLGRGGQITLTFSQGIADGEGFDFAVFENSINDQFLELAWVEVSSDGEHFVRFPNYSWTGSPVGAFGSVDPTLITGYAGKYKRGYGTPFDLSELLAVSNMVSTGTHSFTNSYTEQFTANIAYIDVSNIQYVRVVDVVGDGTAYDSDGFVVYDPYPTSDSAGFDLDAVGVINRSAESRAMQTITFDPIPHQQLDFQALELTAVSDSGLPVSFSIQSGPAAITNEVLFFTGTGTVEVVSTQAGDATYAPASPVLRSFRVAEQIQHIFVEQVPNMVSGIGFFKVHAYSSAGLPVYMEVFSGPATLSISPLAPHVAGLNGETGIVVLRAFQPGSGAIAPAADVYQTVQLLEPSSGQGSAPLQFWLQSNDVPRIAIEHTADRYGRPAVDLVYPVDLKLGARSRIERSDDLVNWTNTVPEIRAQNYTNQTVQMRVRCAAQSTNEYFRLQIEDF